MADEVESSSDVMETGLRASIKPPKPPEGWEKGNVGAHPGAQIHYAGAIHNAYMRLGELIKEEK